MSPGELLRTVRERHGLTQARLALRAGTSQAAISQIERGEVSPSLETLAGMLTAMGERLDLSTSRLPATFEHDAEARQHARRQSMSERLDESLEFAGFAGQLARRRSTRSA
jgi:transcriptional regulator with XRE-family HTH domain